MLSSFLNEPGASSSVNLFEWSRFRSFLVLRVSDLVPDAFNVLHLLLSRGTTISTKLGYLQASWRVREMRRQHQTIVLIRHEFKASSVSLARPSTDWSGFVGSIESIVFKIPVGSLVQSFLMRTHMANHCLGLWLFLLAIAWWLVDLFQLLWNEVGASSSVNYSATSSTLLLSYLDSTSNKRGLLTIQELLVRWHWSERFWRANIIPCPIQSNPIHYTFNILSSLLRCLETFLRGNNDIF
jgi:hypothetical protein